MLKYEMQFVQPETGREARRAIHPESGLQDYRPVPGTPVIEIEAENLESAKAKAARLWTEWPRASRVAGYRLVDEKNRPAYVFDQDVEYELRLARARSH